MARTGVDSLARFMASGLARRGVIKTLAAAALGTIGTTLGHRRGEAASLETWASHAFDFTVSWDADWRKTDASSTTNEDFLELSSLSSAGSIVQVYAWVSNALSATDILSELKSTWRASKNDFRQDIAWFSGPHGFTPEVIQYTASEGTVREEAIYPRRFAKQGHVIAALIGFDAVIDIHNVMAFTKDVYLQGDWGVSNPDGLSDRAFDDYSTAPTPSIDEFATFVPSVTPIPTVVSFPSPTAVTDCSGYSAWRDDAARWNATIRRAQQSPQFAGQILDPLDSAFLTMFPSESFANATLLASRAAAGYDRGDVQAGDTAYQLFVSELARLDALCGA